MHIQLNEKQYFAETEVILNNTDFQKLRYYKQHNWTNRLTHSINVSYISWKIAKKLGCDAGTAARAGLLHDFCLFDFHKKTPTGEHQAFFHPKAAAENSVDYFAITPKERDIILSHMFPLGPAPTSKEGWIVSIVDKICAIAELCDFPIALAKPGAIALD